MCVYLHKLLSTTDATLCKWPSESPNMLQFRYNIDYHGISLDKVYLSV